MDKLIDNMVEDLKSFLSPEFFIAIYKDEDEIIRVVGNDYDISSLEEELESFFVQDKYDPEDFDVEVDAEVISIEKLS